MSYQSPSTRAKPAESQPPPPAAAVVQDDYEDHDDYDDVEYAVDESELPPAAVTSTLVSRFHELQQVDESSGWRKPIRKMTPPRDTRIGANVVDMDFLTALGQHRGSSKTRESCAHDVDGLFAAHDTSHTGVRFE